MKTYTLRRIKRFFDTEEIELMKGSDGEYALVFKSNPVREKRRLFPLPRRRKRDEQ